MKKRILTILIVLTVLIILLVFSGFLFKSSLEPDYKGSQKLANLSARTSVYFDDYGIPHIYADNELDAQRALGFAHAQDRLWQMELMRRIAPGKLSEIFGEVATENDRLFLSMGIDAYSQKSVDELDTNSETYKLAAAYIDGINQFIEEGPTPIEFYILGIDKTPFTLKDTYNIVGYMAFSFAMAHKTDPVLSKLQATLGEDYLKELEIEIPANTTLIKNFNPATTEIATALNKITSNAFAPPFIGSNSWIVNGEKSSTGKVLFANDPHIAFASPSVWYEAHVNTPTYEGYGYYMAGVPFPLLMHNRDFAYGLTMFENDDIDFYLEQPNKDNKNQYKFKEEFLNYNKNSYTVKVKDGEDLNFNVRSTVHGPIMNDAIGQIKTSYPVSMSWIYTKHPNKLLQAVHAMSRAKSLEDVKNGASKIHAPGLNIMYGDANGNVAWWAAGLLYKLPEGSNTKMYLDGSGSQEIQEFLDFSQNPQAINPKWNYVYSANNQPDSIAGILYPGYYLPEDRGRRIVELLEPNNNWSIEDFMQMINDTKSAVATHVVADAYNTINGLDLSQEERKALNILKDWDGDFNKEGIAPTIYIRFMYKFMANTFEDELGEEVFKDFINTHLMKRMIAAQMTKDTSIWFNNIHTTQLEDKTSIVYKSLKDALEALEEQLGEDMNSWTWDRVHLLEHEHPLGTVKLFRPFFNVGSFPIQGSSGVINNLKTHYNDEGYYKVNAGPSTRRIVDFADVENSMSILPTGNSGNPFSKYYKDQSQKYNAGEFRKMKMNKEEIEKVSTLLVLKPKN